MLELKADLKKVKTVTIHGQKVKVKVYSSCYLVINNSEEYDRAAWNRQSIDNEEYDRAAWNRQSIDSKADFINFSKKAGKSYLHTKLGE